MGEFVETARLAREWLEDIAQCSQTQDPDSEGVTRLCASEEHTKANEKLREWMSLSGLEVRMDNAANLVGRYHSPNPNAQTLIFGSHQDTVPNGGKYDGILGVNSTGCVGSLFPSAETRVPIPYRCDRLQR